MMMLIQLDQNKMRNFYHIVIGFAIGYLAFLAFHLYDIPVSWEYWNNSLAPLLGGILAAIPAFLWERRQELKYYAKFDINDVYRTMIGGTLGSLACMLFANWILAGVLVIASILLVVFKEK